MRAFFAIMDVFSLEDNNADGLFLTQSVSSSVGSVSNAGILGDPLDFQSPCVSLVSKTENENTIY